MAESKTVNGDVFIKTGQAFVELNMDGTLLRFGESGNVGPTMRRIIDRTNLHDQLVGLLQRFADEDSCEPRERLIAEAQVFLSKAKDA